MQNQIHKLPKADVIPNEVSSTTPNYIFKNSKVIVQHRKRLQYRGKGIHQYCIPNNFGVYLVINN